MLHRWRGAMLKSVVELVIATTAGPVTVVRFGGRYQRRTGRVVSRSSDPVTYLTNEPHWAATGAASPPPKEIHAYLDFFRKTQSFQRHSMIPLKRFCPLTWENSIRFFVGLIRNGKKAEFRTIPSSPDQVWQALLRKFGHTVVM